MKKLTIITPLYNTKKEYLDDVFNSVKKFSDDKVTKMLNAVLDEILNNEVINE